MDSNDFYNDPLNEGGQGSDFSYAVELYKTACEEGRERSLLLSEDEFIYVIEHFINCNDEENVLKASEIAFGQHSYSSELLVKFADSLIVSGKIEQATGLLNEYKDSFPQNPDISLLYCRINIVNGNYGLARNYFNEVVAFERDRNCTAEAASSIAQDCIDNNNFKEGLYYLLESDKIEPLSYEYYNDLAFCYERLDNLEKSVYYYNKFLDVDPFNDNVWFNLGTIFARQGLFEQAVEAFEYSLALNGGNSSSLYNLAIVYMNMEKYKESAVCFEEFINHLKAKDKKN